MSLPEKLPAFIHPGAFVAIPSGKEKEVVKITAVDMRPGGVGLVYELTDTQRLGADTIEGWHRAYPSEIEEWQAEAARFQEAGREIYAQEQQRRQAQALREALDSPKAAGEGLGAEWANAWLATVYGPIQGRTARVINGTHSFAVELSAGGELARVETHRGATRPGSANMAGVISALRGWLDPQPIGKPLELDPRELRYQAAEGRAAARAVLANLANGHGEARRIQAGDKARDAEQYATGLLAALDAEIPTWVQRNAYITAPDGTRYRVWNVNADATELYVLNVPGNRKVVLPRGVYSWAEFLEGWRPTTTADVERGESGWTPEEMGAPLES